MNALPYVAGQTGAVDLMQQTSVITAINGNIETNNVTGLDANGWPETFDSANVSQVTLRIGALGSTPASGIAWTAANTQIAHNLGRIPTGWRTVYQSAATTITAGTTAPTTQYIYLTSSNTAADTTLEIF